MNQSTQSPATPAQVTLYGIPNCDTVRQARSWLSVHGVGYVFHDFKKLKVPEAELLQWSSALGWDKLLNRKGSTWRQLDDATRDAVHDLASASALMQAHPSVIKRPVVAWADASVTVGFDAAVFSAHVA